MVCYVQRDGKKILEKCFYVNWENSMRTKWYSWPKVIHAAETRAMKFPPDDILTSTFVAQNPSWQSQTFFNPFLACALSKKLCRLCNFDNCIHIVLCIDQNRKTYVKRFFGATMSIGISKNNNRSDTLNTSTKVCIIKQYLRHSSRNRWDDSYGRQRHSTSLRMSRQATLLYHL